MCITKQLSLLIQMVSVAVVIVACSNDSNNSAPAQKPSFVTDPQIGMAPDADTPLVRILTLTTDINTRISLAVSTGNKNWRIDFDEFNTSHSLPVLGFRPDAEHSITVHITSENGEQVTAPNPLLVQTDPLPTGFPVITVQSDTTKMEPGYTLFNVIPEGIVNQGFGALLVIVDETGDIVWYHKGSRFSDHRKLPNGNLLYLQGGFAIEMDMLGNRIRQWQAVGQSGNPGVATESFHHELYPINNDRFIVLSVELRSFNDYPSSETDPLAPRLTAEVVGDVIVEFSSNGDINRNWKLLDLLDPYRIGYNSLEGFWDGFFGGKTTRDWSHANGVIHDPKDDSIIVSVRNQDAIIKFNRKNGELIWILGPHENWASDAHKPYLLTPGTTNQPNFFPYHAHAPAILPNGNIMLYDNGNFRTSPPTPSQDPWGETFSRAVEYSIDEQNKTVELVWQYGQSENVTYFSGALGDADPLPTTGNVLITHGSLYNVEGKSQNSARVMEVTKTLPAEEVFTMTVTDATAVVDAGWRVYRSDRIDSLYP